MQKPSTKIKRKVSKTTGIPTTSSGRKRKAQKAATCGGCLIPIIGLIAVVFMATIAGCSAVSSNQTESTAVTTAKATEKTTEALTTAESPKETAEIAPVDYETVSTSEYARDGKKCIGYRVYVPDKDATDEQLLDIYSKVTNDAYYLHTVWIYFDRKEAEGGLASATIEETSKGVTPTTVERSGW